MKNTRFKVIDGKEEALSEKRADVRAAIALRDEIVSFNGEARERNTLTEPDRRKIAGIAENLDAFEKESMRVSSGAWDTERDTQLSNRAADVINGTRLYLAKTEGVMTVEWAGKRDSVPAIESAALRAKLYADGQSLVGLLTTYLDYVHLREERKADSWKRELDAFTAAMDIKPVAALVTAFEELDRTPELSYGGAGHNVRFRILDEIGTLQNIFKRQIPQPFSTKPKDLLKLIDAYRANTSTGNTAA